MRRCLGRRAAARATPGHQLDLGTLAHSRDCRSSTRGRLRSFCGPFLLSLRSVCDLQTNEQPRTRANTIPQGPAFSGVSPVFAGLRGSLTNRGERFRFALQCGFGHSAVYLRSRIPRPCQASPSPRPRVCHTERMSTKAKLAKTGQSDEGRTGRQCRRIETQDVRARWHDFGRYHEIRGNNANQRKPRAPQSRAAS
jgi:hypothetical protein